MASQDEKRRMEPLDYAIFGVLCAAKKETGPEGARRMYRIQERIDVWDDTKVSASLVRLMIVGWVEQQKPNEFGFIYYNIKI